MPANAPSRFRLWPAALLIALLAAGGAALFQWQTARSIAAAAREPVAINELPAPAAPAQPPANIRVARHLASMQLVTSTIDAMVSVERRDESWRGSVSAAVEVPVRYRFATDLSQLDASRVKLYDGTALCLIDVPAPARLSVEVGEPASEDVKVGWLRTRSRAGEFYLSQARKDAAAAARSRELSEREDAQVREDTRTQVSALVRSILGEGTRVLVRFEDQPTEQTPVPDSTAAPGSIAKPAPDHS